MPDITLSSLMESPDEILHDVTKIPLYVHMASAVFLFMCSSMFHLCYCHSKGWYKTFSRLDYGAIPILIGGSYFPPFYYIFYCKEHSSKPFNIQSSSWSS